MHDRVATTRKGHVATKNGGARGRQGRIVTYSFATRKSAIVHAHVHIIIHTHTCTIIHTFPGADTDQRWNFSLRPSETSTNKHTSNSRSQIYNTGPSSYNPGS